MTLHGARHFLSTVRMTEYQGYDTTGFKLLWRFYLSLFQVFAFGRTRTRFDGSDFRSFVLSANLHGTHHGKILVQPLMPLLNNWFLFGKDIETGEQEISRPLRVQEVVLPNHIKYIFYTWKKHVINYIFLQRYILCSISGCGGRKGWLLFNKIKMKVQGEQIRKEKIAPKIGCLFLGLN